MRRVRGVCLCPALIVALIIQGRAQESSTTHGAQPLVLTGAIPLPNVQGRIDHFGYDPKGRLFVSALGNDTEEVLDLFAGTRTRSISVPRPQGVVYSPEFNKLFVASSQGKLYVYDGTSFDLLTAIDFHGDVDNLRYDAPNQRVYVGYGDGKAAAIGIIDAATNQRLAKEFKLGAHPESFQLETSGPEIFVNLPELQQLAVINRTTGATARWPLALGGNYPMALDEADHRLFIATHAPPHLVVLDANRGHVVARLPCVANADDMYYDRARKRIYVTGGEGYISVFQQRDADRYLVLANVPSAVGARTSEYFGKQGHKGFDRFYTAVPARACHAAEVLIYAVRD